MKRFWILTMWMSALMQLASGQVAEMKWELDYEVYLSMANDSNYSYDIRTLFHVTDVKDMEYSSEFVFYPVNPSEEFARNLHKEDHPETYKTLWSALHAKLGGGWIHFINCIAYALETRSLNLTEPIMERPETSWKPDPVTESWKRTRRWKYYVPVSQKLAQKEYKIRRKNGELGDLENLPSQYIVLFLSTSDREYKKMQEEQNYSDAAKIDLVKVMLASNYLGEAQINYVSNAVLNAVTNYSSSKLPSVIIFDEFNAAAAMSLDDNGYRLESVVFNKAAHLTPEQIKSNREEIEKIIETINQYNKMAFEKRLGTYYGPK